MRLIDADALKETIEEHVTTVSCCPTVDWSMGKTQMKKQVIEDIDDAPTVEGWISVNDRLPDEHGLVLAVVKYKVGWFRVLAWREIGEWLSNDPKFEDSDGQYIAYWMPLPEPPQEVTENAND